MRVELDGTRGALAREVRWRFRATTERLASGEVAVYGCAQTSPIPMQWTDVASMMYADLGSQLQLVWS